MSNDYHFNFTDPTKTAFAVKPYTVNGYSTPDSVPLPSFYSTGGVTAVGANTSLVFVGKGMPEYGDAVQNNFVYLLENFANVNPPINPIEGQIWYKNVDLVDGVNPTNKGLYVSNGTTWDRLLVETSTGLTGDLNMGGFNITNLGGTGIGYNAVNELDVALAVASHAADTDLHLTPTQNVLLDGLDPLLTAVELNYVKNTTSEIQGQLNSKVSKTGDTMSGQLSMGSNKIVALADPTAPDDAATRGWVLSEIGAATGGADGVVTSGNLDPVSGVLTLNRSIGTPVVVAGTFAPSSHSQNDDTVWHDLSTPISMSWLAGVGLGAGMYPQMSLYNLLVFMDQQLYEMQRHTHRQIIQTNGETTITLDPSMEYSVNENRLQVFLNGVKQIASERGSSKIVCTGDNIGLTTDTGLLPTTPYAFDITVDGVGPTTISITTPSGVTSFATLVDLIVAELLISGLGVSINIDQYFGYLKIAFVSHTSGNGSSVSVSFGPTELFQSIVGTPGATPPNPIIVTAPVDTSITTNYAYEEVGEPNGPSTDILFYAALPVGATLEVLSL